MFVEIGSSNGRTASAIRQYRNGKSNGMVETSLKCGAVFDKADDHEPTMTVDNVGHQCRLLETLEATLTADICRADMLAGVGRQCRFCLSEYQCGTGALSPTFSSSLRCSSSCISIALFFLAASRPATATYSILHGV